jgi:hypothetical protein
MRSMFLMAAALVAVNHDAGAQVRIQTAPGAFAYALGDPDRAMIGVSTRGSGKRDTLGLLVESVTTGSPAEKAGIEEGDRLVSVNGVNLRLSAADAGESDMDGVTNRRLIRELEKHKAGDEVELRVYRDGATRTVRVKTVAADELNNAAHATTTGTWSRTATDRAVIGISLGGSGSKRDTLGVLIVGVADEGPAARAGVDEGDRVASINGVDLRVAGEDAGDWQASSSRIRRLNREMEKVKAGDAVELRVWSNGQARTVRVEAAKASDVEGDAFFFNGAAGLLDRIRTMPLPRGTGTVRVLPRISSGRDVPAVAIPQLEVERRLRAAQGLKGRAEQRLMLKERLETAAQARRSTRVVGRTLII